MTTYYIYRYIPLIKNKMLILCLHAVTPNAIDFWPIIAYKVNSYDLVNATEPSQVTLMGKQFCLDQVSLVAPGCLH